MVWALFLELNYDTKIGHQQNVVFGVDRKPINGHCMFNQLLLLKGRLKERSG